MLKEQLFNLLDRADGEYALLKEKNQELQKKYDTLQSDFTGYQQKYTRFLSALNLRLLPLIFDNEKALSKYQECFELLITNEIE